MLSPAAYGGTAMLRAIAACPLVTPIVAADARIQVVSVADVARTVALRAQAGRAGARDLAARASAGASAGDIVLAMRDWLG